MTSHRTGPGATHVPRGIAQQVIDAAIAEPSRLQILSGPRGSGKSSLLRHVAARLAGAGRLPVLIDIERISISPTDFALSFTEAIAGALSRLDIAAPRAATIRARLASESSRRRPDPARLLDLALDHARAAAEASAPPLVLLLDELAEVTWLARHAGLRDAMTIVARRLTSPPAPAIIASVSPGSRPAALLEQLSREAGGSVSLLELEPMNGDELAAMLRAHGHALDCGPDAIERWLRATGGRPLYAEILARRAAAGEDLAVALAAEMTPPAGSLHQECRFDYHLLVERSRGHSVVRTILTLLARREGMHLSGIAEHLRITLPTALDYLSWLLEVGLIRRDGRGYVFADPVLRLWVRLNGPDPLDPLEEAVAFLETPRTVPAPPSRPRGRRPGTAARRKPPYPQRLPASRDLLIEID